MPSSAGGRATQDVALLDMADYAEKELSGASGQADFVLTTSACGAFQYMKSREAEGRATKDLALLDRPDSAPGGRSKTPGAGGINRRKSGGAVVVTAATTRGGGGDKGSSSRSCQSRPYLRLCCLSN